MTIWRKDSESVGTVRVTVPVARLQIAVLAVADQDQSVGQVREFGQHAVNLVLDQAVDLAVRAVGLMLDPSLLTDVVGAEAIEDVDGVDDDGS